MLSQSAQRGRAGQALTIKAEVAVNLLLLDSQRLPRQAVAVAGQKMRLPVWMEAQEAAGVQVELLGQAGLALAQTLSLVAPQEQTPLAVPVVVVEAVRQRQVLTGLTHRTVQAVTVGKGLL
tara:strand:+ start:354 stop:716 length:363 start_codon:yes stop_codon:yes gene_type:complete